MGSLWEFLSFVLRTLGARDQQNQAYVIASTLLILLAPLCMPHLPIDSLVTKPRLLTTYPGINAFVYMIVARLVYYLLPQERILGMSPRWLAKIFVAADIVSFLVQAVGGAMLANTEGGDTVITGQRIYMSGIGVQLLFVIIFGVVTVVLLHRLEQRMRSGTLVRSTAWVRPLIWVLIAVILLIVVRSTTIPHRVSREGMTNSTSNRSASYSAWSSSEAALQSLTRSSGTKLTHSAWTHCQCSSPL